MSERVDLRLLDLRTGRSSSVITAGWRSVIKAAGDQPTKRK